MIASAVSVVLGRVIYFAGWISGDTVKQLAMAYEKIAAALPFLRPFLEEPALCVSATSFLIGAYCLISDMAMKSHYWAELPPPNESPLATPPKVIASVVDKKPDTSVVPTRQAVDQHVYAVDFKSKAMQGKNPKWKLDRPTGDQLKESLKKRLGESPHGSALKIDTGGNSIIHEMEYCRPDVKRVEFRGHFDVGSRQYVKLRLRHPTRQAIGPYFLTVCGVGESVQQGFSRGTQLEFDVCVPAEKIEKSGWERRIVCVDKLFSQTFAKQGYILEGVDGIYLRGKMTIATIRMYNSSPQVSFPAAIQSRILAVTQPVDPKWLLTQLGRVPTRFVVIAACLAGIVLLNQLPSGAPPLANIESPSQGNGNDKGAAADTGDVIPARPRDEQKLPQLDFKDFNIPPDKVSKAQAEYDEYLSRSRWVECRECKTRHEMPFEEFAKTAGVMNCVNCGFVMHFEQNAKLIADEIIRLRKAVAQ